MRKRRGIHGVSPGVKRRALDWALLGIAASAVALALPAIAAGAPSSRNHQQLHAERVAARQQLEQARAAAKQQQEQQAAAALAAAERLKQQAALAAAAAARLAQQKTPAAQDAAAKLAQQAQAAAQAAAAVINKQSSAGKLQRQQALLTQAAGLPSHSGTQSTVAARIASGSFRLPVVASSASLRDERQQRHRDVEQRRQQETEQLRQQLLTQASLLTAALTKTASAAGMTSGGNFLSSGVFAQTATTAIAVTSTVAGSDAAATAGTKVGALPGMSSLGASDVKAEDGATGGKTVPDLGKGSVAQSANPDEQPGSGRLALVPPARLRVTDPKTAAKQPAKMLPKRRASATPPSYLPAPGDTFMRGEILATNVDPGRLPAGFEHGGTIAIPGSAAKVERLLLPPTMEVGEARDILRGQQPDANSSPNYIYHPYRVAVESKQGTDSRQRPTATTCEGCYGRELIHWDPKLASCATQLKVGVIDTAHQKDHRAFEGRSIVANTFHPKDSKPAKDVWHGTSVLSLLAGNPQSSTPGLIPNARFFAADAFFADVEGQPVTSTTSLLDALNWMAREQVKIVNMSLSGPNDKVLGDAIAGMSAAGVAFIAAAGNGGPDADPSFPAAYPQVIAVTAVDQNSKHYRYANQGSYIDLAAPGVAVLTALPNGGDGLKTGTSFAAPYATAVVAAIYPAEELHYRGSPLDTKQLLLKRMSIRDLGPDRRMYGRGLLQAPAECAAPMVAKAPWTAKVDRVSLNP
jgi:hypothetical protein